MRHITAAVLACLLFAASIIPMYAQSSSEMLDGCVGPVLGAGLRMGEQGLVDRFNYPWKPSDRLVKYSAARASLKSVDCGGFHVDFEDVIDENRRGFDDRTPVVHSVLGMTTLGAVRQRTVCEVLGYIGRTINVKGTPDIIIQASQLDGTGFLAAGGPFFNGNGGAVFMGGSLYDHITTGVDPTPGAGMYDAQIVFDFGLRTMGGYTYGINSDWSIAPGNMIDLYSITLHEMTHALGFLSLIGPSGGSTISRGYSLFDKRMQDKNARPVIDPTTGTFQSTSGELISNSLVFHGEHCDQITPVYSPASFQVGSSLSHFDQNRSGLRYVMRPATSGGDDRVYTDMELQVFCDMGYSMAGNICSGCAPRGVEDLGNIASGEEVCLDVLANDINPGGGTLAIAPGSATIDVGGGAVRINGNRLCYIPPIGFYGVARLYYAPTNGTRIGSKTLVRVNVSKPSPPGPRKDYNIWYFGSLAGMSFSGGNPVPLADGQANTLEGTSVICDSKTGALQLYTDGSTVWDARHRVMPNGEGLKGHWTSAQSALIVRKPGDPSIFYIFTTGAGPYHQPNPNTGMRYSIVDLRRNGGYGEVIEKNIELIPQSTEQLTATRHCNGTDYWVMGHEWGTNKFYAYLLSSRGVSGPVISSVGAVYPRDENNLAESGHNCQGAMKFSSDARRLAAVNTYLNIAGLYDFNNATGLVSNQILLTDDKSLLYYSPAFSPDNSKLYISMLTDPNRGKPDAILQFDLSSGVPDIIRNSLYKLPIRQNGSWTGGEMQLGPDGRIYVAVLPQPNLRVINNPNLAGAACGYVEEGFYLGRDKNNQHGMPNCIEYDMLGTVGDNGLKLTISNHVDKPEPRFGDTVTYTIRLCNLSCGEAREVVIEDFLPSGVSYLDGLSAYPRHTFDLIAPGECRSVTLRGVVMNTAVLGVAIPNCVSVVAGLPAVGYVPLDSNCADITIHGTDIAVRKEVSAPIARSGDAVTFTLSFVNLGPEATTNIIARDLLPSGLTYLSHAATRNAVVYNSVSGDIFIPALSAGDSCVLTIECQIAGTSNVQNCASVLYHDKMDLDITNNRSCACVEVRGCNQFPVLGGIEFGQMSWCSDSTATIRLRNLCESTLQINGILPPESSVFEMTAGALPVSIPEGGSAEFLLKFKPGAPGNWIDRIGYSMAIVVAGETHRDTVWQAVHGAATDLHAVAEISKQYVVPPGQPVRTPVMLRHPLDPARVRRLGITLEYDSTCVIMLNDNNQQELLAGTLLEGWAVESSASVRGRLTMTLRAPGTDVYLHGTGMLLNPELMMYLASRTSSVLSLSLLLDESRCVDLEMVPGLIKIGQLSDVDAMLASPGSGLSINRIAPNPFSDYVDINYSTLRNAPVRLNIVDVTGRTVQTLVDENVAAGNHTVRWSSRSFSPGIYFCQLETGGRTIVARMALVK